MNNYDDLQRFKEKTQTLDIAFKDMSGQTQGSSRSQWALIRQLETDEQHETPLGGGERIDTPQPQPIRAGELSAQAQPAAQPAAQPRASLLDSLAATVKPTATERVLTPPLTAPLSPAPASPAPAAQPAPVSHSALQAPVKTMIRQEAPVEASRFGALFRTRASEPVSVSKETLLKPLLEKIALCR